MFRSGDITTRGHNTNNYSDAFIRILKDVVLCRTKAYNAVALAEHIMRDWEHHFETRLMRHANRRVGSHLTTYERLLQKLPNFTRQDVHDLADGAYRLPSSSCTRYYDAEVELGFCTCPAGRQGAFCKHQAVVHHHYGGSFPNCPSLTDADCQTAGLLGTRRKVPSPRISSRPATSRAGKPGSSFRGSDIRDAA